MSRTIQMMNADDTPFYANLNAPSTVTISIGEAYNLITTLQEQHAFILATSSRDDVPADMRDLFRQQATELERRVAEIETTIDHDKYQQWAAVSPAWAIRAGAR